MPIIKASAKISNMRLQKKPVETTATNVSAETTSTEVKLSLKARRFFVNYVNKTVRCGNFILSAAVVSMPVFLIILLVLSRL